MSGFISFLNKTYGLKLKREIKHHEKQKKRTKDRLENKLIQMMMKPQEDEKFEIQWIIMSLAYFHDLPINIAKKIQMNGLNKTDYTGFTFEWLQKTYWIPAHYYRLKKTVKINI